MGEFEFDVQNLDLVARGFGASEPEHGEERDANGGKDGSKGYDEELGAGHDVNMLYRRRRFLGLRRTTQLRMILRHTGRHKGARLASKGNGYRQRPSLP